jgi:hypothetical protein
MHFTLMSKHVARKTAICHNTLTHNITEDRKKTWPIINRQTLQYVMYLRKYKVKQIFVDTEFWHMVCL